MIQKIKKATDIVLLRVRPETRTRLKVVAARSNLPMADLLEIVSKELEKRSIISQSKSNGTKES